MRRFGGFLLVTTMVLGAAVGCGSGPGAPPPPTGQLKIELFDGRLMRPTDAVGAVQVAEIGELEADVHGRNRGEGCRS